MSSHSGAKLRMSQLSERRTMEVPKALATCDSQSKFEMRIYIH